MACTCGICQPDRPRHLAIDDAQRTLSVRLIEAEATAHQLVEDAGRMTELAHAIGDDPANPIQHQSFCRLIRWAKISHLAAARLRDLVAEVSRLSRELL